MAEPASRSRAANADEAQAEKPSLPDVIEKIGLGPAQFRAAMCGAMVWLADGAELLLISSVTLAVADEWDLSAFTQGAIVTMVYLGILLGNLCSGPGGSYFGRREMIITSYVGIFVFSILCSLAPNIKWLMLWRCLVGWSIGLGQPAWLAVSVEVTPSAYRVVMGGATQSLFCFGEVYSAYLLIIDDPSLQDLHWRTLLQLGALPALVMIFLSTFFLIQSPSFLADQGRHDEAVKVLESLRAQNNAGDFDVDFRLANSTPPNQENGDTFSNLVQRQLKVIFGNKLLLPTVVVAYSCFMLNLSYYGCMFAFPQVLPDLVESGAASQLLVGALMELPGMAIGTMMGLACYRNSSSKFYITLTACFLLMFVIGANNHSRHWAFQVAVYIGYYGIKMIPQIGFVIIYMVANEIYPSEARTTGCAICLAGGRVAAMIGPLMYELSVELTGTWLAFFLLVAAGCVLNLYLIDFVPETAGRLLSDDVGESSVPEKLHGDKAVD